MIPFDLNKGARGSYNYLCVTYEQVGPPVSAVTFLKFGSAYPWGTHGDWQVFQQDLLVNGGGSYVYVGYKLAQGGWTTKDEQVPKDISNTVTRYNTVITQRPIKRQRTVTRTVTRTEEHRLQPEDFYLQAVQQIREEIRASLRQDSTEEATDVSPNDSVSMVAGGVAGAALDAEGEVVSLREALSLPADDGGACPLLTHSVGAEGFADPTLDHDTGDEGTDETAFSWISVGDVNQSQCFLGEALFCVVSENAKAAGYKEARDLEPGSRVLAADGHSALSILDITPRTSEELMSLRAGSAMLRVTPSHRVVIPSISGSQPWALASTLKEGELVICSNGTHRLTEVKRVLSKEEGLHHFEVFAIRFSPNLPVAVFEQSIQSLGIKDIRRGRGGRRSRPVTGPVNAKKASNSWEVMSIPDTAKEFSD